MQLVRATTGNGLLGDDHDANIQIRDEDPSDRRVRSGAGWEDDGRADNWREGGRRCGLGERRRRSVRREEGGAL